MSPVLVTSSRARIDPIPTHVLNPRSTLGWVRLHVFAGGRVVYADVSPTRVALAQQTGLETFVSEVDLIESLQSGLSQDPEVMVDATSVTGALPSAIAVAKAVPSDDIPISGARVIIQGSYPADSAVPYMATPMKELSIYVPRDVKPIDLRIVLDLVARRKIDLDGIISAVRSPESAAQTYTGLADPKTSLITVAFKGSDDCLLSLTHLCHKNTNGSNWFKQTRSTSSRCVKQP